MIRIPGIPLLPGTLIQDVQKTNHPLVQKFVTIGGVNMLVERKVPCLINKQGISEDVDCPPYELPSMYAPKIGPKLPPWFVYDKKVLCFHGYFKETLQEVYRAPYQVRKVKILYYLEDGTIQVSEPRVDNSGIPQGCLVTRQRIPRPAPNRKEFLTMMDLNVKACVTIYDRTYHITGCDLFTRHFLNRAGIHVPDPVETPSDPTTEIRRKASSKPYIPSNKDLAFAQFLEFDRNVLKFFGYWNDTTEFGDVRNLEICYYLADDTLEVKEIFPMNSGRTGPSIFLKRAKLPKEWKGLALPGADTKVTVLNVLGGGKARGGRYMEDVLGIGSQDITYYKERDLQIGAHLNVYGRDIILIDCDEYTKEFYRKKYGIESFIPLPNLAKQSNCVYMRQERKLPPFNGWGTHEDSEGNCKSVLPTAPQIDLKKFIVLDRFILRFGAKMLSKISENCDRIFIISYFLSNDTISIFELATRNSGFLGGAFLNRRKIMLPEQDLFSSKRPEYYKPHHFYVGSTLNIFEHIFHLVSADEYSLMYMENHPFEFPYADIETIMTKIREAIRPIYKNFIAKYLSKVLENANGPPHGCYIDSNTMQMALIDLLGKHIQEHEIITVCRYFTFGKPSTEKCNRETVRSAAHWEIHRNLWDDLDRFKEHIYQLEPTTPGFLSKERIRSFLVACRLPFSKDLTNNIISVLNRNPCGDIEICDLVHFINVKGCPAPAIQPMNAAFELCPDIPFLSRGMLVDWNQFIRKLGLEEELAKEGE